MPGYYGAGYYGAAMPWNREVNANVSVFLTAGGPFSVTSGILGRAYPGHIGLVQGNVISMIPNHSVAAVSKLAGGGPVAPVPGFPF